MATFSGDVSQTGPTVLFQYQATATTLVAIRRAPTRPGDPLDGLLKVFDAAGAVVALDSDPDGGLDSLARFDAIAGRTYVIEASLTTGPASGPFEFLAAPDDFGDSTATAHDLPLAGNRPEVQAGAIEAPGDVDAFRFVAPRSGPLTVRVDAAPGGELAPSLAVEDALRQHAGRRPRGRREFVRDPGRWPGKPTSAWSRAGAGASAATP